MIINSAGKRTPNLNRVSGWPDWRRICIENSMAVRGAARSLIGVPRIYGACTEPARFKVSHGPKVDINLGSKAGNSWINCVSGLNA